MSLKIKIDSKSSTPKYEQIINEIIRLIRSKQLQIGDILPSINALCKILEVSRDTVVIAYNELKERGIINPRQGKGFYVSSITIKNKLKIFLLFDVMNSYKEVLYRSFIKSLGPNYQVDIYFHYYNLKVFEQLISNNLNNYGFYVVMPHFNEDVSEIVKKIQREKLLIIDKDITALTSDYAAVFQNFDKDVYEVFKKAHPLFQKYKNIQFIDNRNFQFIPDGVIAGFNRYCKEFGMKKKFVENIESARFEKGSAFFIITDHDLIECIKMADEKQWVLGQDIGIISYDETPLKQVLAGGITVISTDFKKMGETAAQMIKNQVFGKIENPYIFMQRKSL